MPGVILVGVGMASQRQALKMEEAIATEGGLRRV